MKIKSIELNNFKIWKHLDLNFSNNINIIYGSNGIGKTAILNSLFFISSNKFLNSETNENVINRNSKRLMCKYIFSNDLQADLIVDKDTREYYVDGKIQKNFITLNSGGFNSVYIDNRELLEFQIFEYRRLEILRKMLHLIDIPTKDNYDEIAKDVSKINKIIKSNQNRKIKITLLKPLILKIANSQYDYIKKEKYIFSEIIEIFNSIFKEIFIDYSSLNISFKYFCNLKYEDISVKKILEFYKVNLNSILKGERNFTSVLNNKILIQYKNNNFINEFSKGQTRIIQTIFYVSILKLNNYSNNKLLLLLDDYLSDLDKNSIKVIIKMLSNIENQIIIATPNRIQDLNNKENVYEINL